MRLLRGERDPATRRVTVVTRAGCHLCAEAEATVARLAAELGFAVETVDVDCAEPAFRARHTDQVPVVLVDGRTVGFWRVDEARLRAALTR